MREEITLVVAISSMALLSFIVALGNASEQSSNVGPASIKATVMTEIAPDIADAMPYTGRFPTARVLRIQNNTTDLELTAEAWY